MPAGRNTSPPQVAASRFGVRALGLFFAAQFFFLIFFQKIAIPIGILPLSVPFVAFYAGLAGMLMFSRVEISAPKAAVYSLFFAAVVLSQMLSTTSRFSTPSMLMLLALYLPLIFVWRVPQAQYEALFKPFQDFMLICAGVVLLQLAWQAVIGPGTQPNMERYVPQRFLVPGYNYAAPMHYGAAFVRPNGFFFLEPSFIAMFLACALILEITYFRRLWRMAFYGVAMLGTFGATGTIMVLIAAPFMIRGRPTMWMVMISPLVIGLGIFGMMYTGLFNRIGELSNPAASGWQRIVGPMIQLGQALADPHHIITGQGAGSLSEVLNWPMTKVAVEYGSLDSFIFVIFVTAAMMTSRNRPIFWPLLVIFQLTGGYLITAVMVELLTLMCCLVAPTEPVERRPLRIRRPVVSAAEATAPQPSRPEPVS